MPDYRPAAARIARRHGIPVGLFSAMINQESGWNPRARSPAGARGLGQLMPATARSLGVNPDKPLQNLEGAARYLSKAKQSFGSWKLALAAYNAGFGAVSKYKGVPPYAETQNYVKKIMAHSSVSAGGTPLKTANVMAVGGGSPGMTMEARRLQFALTPDPKMKDILSRSVGERVSDLLGKGIPLPAMNDNRIAQEAYNLTPPGAPVTNKGWQRWVKLAGNADRPGVHTNPSVLAFVGSIGKAAHQRLMIGTGSRHSRLTVNGNVSNHWDGHAADIPASGKALRKLGYLALIQAGMSPIQARDAQRTGGLFNVGPYQIIFATNEGGNHFNHLHVGVRG